jgi:hypothetical protein
VEVLKHYCPGLDFKLILTKTDNQVYIISYGTHCKFIGNESENLFLLIGSWVRYFRGKVNDYYSGQG